MPTLHYQVPPTDDPIRTTAGITSHPTATRAQLTSTFLLDLSLITSEQPMTVMTATIVFKSTDKVQCSSWTMETPTHSEHFGHGINLNSHTREVHMPVLV